jgi:hypothetical protein
MVAAMLLFAPAALRAQIPCQSVDMCVQGPLPCGDGCYCWHPAANPNPPGPEQGVCAQDFGCDHYCTTNADCTNPARPVCYEESC